VASHYKINTFIMSTNMSDMTSTVTLSFT